MKYFHRTHLPPDEVLVGATQFFGATLAPMEPDRLELISTLDYAYRELSAQAHSEPTKENVIARFREFKRDKFPQQEVEEAFEMMKEARFF
jgi:hypothetical protein